MLKVGVVGLGWWGKQIVNSLEDSDEIQVVRGVDVNVDAVKDFAEAKGFPLTDRYEDVLEDKNVDGVILVTPHGLHEEQVLAAAKAGKQVFCEKPFALHADAAKRMIEACEKNNITVGIGHERRYEAAHEEILRMLKDGELGRLLHVEANWSHNNFAGKPASGWRQDSKQAPAGTLTALGVHMTDYLQSLAGPVEEIYARMSHRSDDFPAEDIISIQLSFRNGVTGYLCDVATTPFYQRISVFGDRSWVESKDMTNVDIPEPAVLTWRGMDHEMHTRTYKWANTVGANLDAWAKAAQGKGEYRFTPDQILHNVEILEAIVKSADSGKPVKIG